VIIYPYHRYMAYRLVSGDRPGEVCKNIEDLGFLPPKLSDVEKLRDNMTRARISGSDLFKELKLEVFERTGPSADAMYWIVETPAARASAEAMLIDRVDLKAVAAVLGHKFNARVTAESVEMFRDGFWDTVTLTPMDFSFYFRLGGKKKPEPPPERVPLSHREHYTSWRNGVVPGDEEISVEEMIRSIAVDSYFQFKELSSRPDPESRKQALSFASMVLKTAPVAMRKSSAKNGLQVPALAPILTYPADTALSLEDLEDAREDDQ